MAWRDWFQWMRDLGKTPEEIDESRRAFLKSGAALTALVAAAAVLPELPEQGVWQVPEKLEVPPETKIVIADATHPELPKDWLGTHPGNLSADLHLPDPMLRVYLDGLRLRPVC